MNTIGERLKCLRKERGMSQKTLGELLGVSQQMITQYETGKRTPKIETVRNIAEVLETTPDYLIGWDDDPYDYDNYDGYLPEPFIGNAKGYFAFLKAEEDDYQNELNDFYEKRESVTPQEMNMIEKYRILDDHGIKMVDFTLQAECERTMRGAKTTQLNAAHADDYANAPEELRKKRD